MTQPNQGRLITLHTGEQTKPQTVYITRPPQHILTIGFQVNRPWALYGKKHYVLTDYGHCFFYITKANQVIDYFSYGVKGQLAPTFKPLQATTDYGISEITQLFRFTLLEKQAQQIQNNIAHFNQQIEAGEIHYSSEPEINSATMAREILLKSRIITLAARGAIVKSQQGKPVTIPHIITPYLWYQSFIESFAAPISYYGSQGEKSLIHAADEKELLATITPPWYLSEQKTDPLLHSKQPPIIHGAFDKQAKQPALA